MAYLDELDPTCLDGGIHFHGRAYGALWDICSKDHLRVVADVHTHPGIWVDQSGVDMENPMIVARGHVALIVPNLALGRVRPRDVGVHLYDGNDWRHWTGWAAREYLYVGRWA